MSPWNERSGRMWGGRFSLPVCVISPVLGEACGKVKPVAHHRIAIET
jgi:hypothetical protein